MLAIGRALMSGPQLSPDAREALAKRSRFRRGSAARRSLRRWWTM
jgi:hypothetical protein